jgi:hypothetical protein
MAKFSFRGEKKDSDTAGDERALDKLLDIIHFTEEISTKITPFMDEGTIFNTLVEEFRNSDRYGLTILKLTGDRSRLYIIETAIKDHLIRAAEKLSGIKIEDFTIDYRESEAFRRVVLGGETIQVEYSRIIEEAVSSNPVLRKVVGQIVKALHVQDKYNILTPLRSGGKVIGVLEISSTDLGELFIPSVKIFGLHVSRTLDLAREHEEGKRTRDGGRHIHTQQGVPLHVLEQVNGEVPWEEVGRGRRERQGRLGDIPRGSEGGPRELDAGSHGGRGDPPGRRSLQDGEREGGIHLDNSPPPAGPGEEDPRHSRGHKGGNRPQGDP